MDNRKKPTITIKQMRTLLGKEFKDTPDELVQEMIDYQELCADIIIKEIKATLLVPNSGLVGCSQPKKLRK